MNESGITPLGDRCLIRVHSVEERTQGGIIIPDEYRDKKQMAQLTATLLENGEIADQKLDLWPEPGDTVVISKYAGIVYKDEDTDVEYRIVNCDDIVGVMKNA